MISFKHEYTFNTKHYGGDRKQPYCKDMGQDWDKRTELSVLESMNLNPNSVAWFSFSAKKMESEQFGPKPNCRGD